MIKIIFSDHALKRCKQQNVNVDKLKRELSLLPHSDGRISWRMNNGDYVVLKFKERSLAFVVTVVSRKKYKSSRKPSKSISK
ncbi:hypothetical protein PCURB6_27790 [Paenibacillus curdlanolyticus]|nr:hypothetical protein PCURB6_27790 [Paenibacillus curdlanolyticus]